jgi:hypothetical protein
MFLAHFGAGFASKRLAPRASLGALIAAPIALDLLWPIFVIAGIEQVRVDPGNTAVTPLDFVSYPYSHSAVMALLWAVVGAALYWMATRHARGAIVIAAGVFSHWVLDFVSHRPDMPLVPGNPTRVGLGLWNSRPATLVAELAVYGAGVWLYARSTRPRTRRGSVALWVFVGLLAAFYFMSFFGPPPPSVGAIAWGGLAAWLFPLWAWWIDRNREAT